MRQPRALRDLRPRHPLHQPKDERFAVRRRKGADRGQNHVSLLLGGVAGYSGTPLARKLGVLAGHALLLDGAPTDFTVEGLPDGVTVRRRAGSGPYDVIVRAAADSVDQLGQLVVAKVQNVEGITRTLTCPVVHL